jgi:two-component system, NtrC family, response regulator AtoC
MIATYILIVDDDEAIRELLKEYFKGFGYEITTASSGAEALTMISQHNFDCIISDHVIPDMNGLELLEELTKEGKKIPFLMITGYPSIEIAVEVMKRGGYDYITKPLQLEDVRIKVERALHRKGLEKSVKKLTGIAWASLISIPIWLILGIILGKIWHNLLP